MLNPIKRVWVPKATPLLTPTPERPPETHPQPAPASTPPIRADGRRNALFDELPAPDMEEKNSDSIWAAFDSVHKPEIERK
jgi:hypothetical protein